MNNLVEFFKCSSDKDTAKLQSYIDSGNCLQKIDTLAEQLEELAFVEDPRKISHIKKIQIEAPAKRGIWVYLPWHKTAVRVLEKENYRKLRLSRNDYLITPQEQKILSSSKIAFAGLNVGNPGAVAMALQGICLDMKLADFDPLSLSNLNRFRAGITDMGVNKSTLTARQILETDPYANIELFEEGITDVTIDAFLGDPKVSLLVEEVDNLKMKILLREKARLLGIPVLMVTGNGEELILDIERYDLDKNLPILNGHLSQKLQEEIFAVVPGEGSFEDRVLLARDFMGKEVLTERLLSSFEMVGSKLAGIPQLAQTSFLRGAALAHYAKKILTENFPSGRYIISLDPR